MTVGFALLVGALPLALTLLATFRIVDGKFPWDLDLAEFGILAGVAFVGFCIPYAWDTHLLFGLASGFFPYALLIGGAVVDHFKRAPEFESSGTWFFLGAVVCTIAAIPASVLPALRAGDPILTAANVAVDTVEAATDISAIEGKFSDLQQVLQAEGEKIQASLESVLGEVEHQNVELKGLRAEEQRLTAELETYKKLLELDKGQVAAIQSTLRKKDATDYWVGLLTGVLSSAAVAFGSSFLGRKGRPRKAAAEGG